MALVYTPEAELGSPCPTFRLPSVTGESFDSAALLTNRPFLVMFICNHCPYVKAIEDRLIEVGRIFRKKNLPVVAICSNDPADYPEDSFENLASRAREKGYPFPYLFDETQDVAKSFGAVCTPDFFLYDEEGKLAYRGRLDDSWKDAAKVKRRELMTALDRLLAGEAVDADQVPSMGCSIKWKDD
ncbi:MAG TPA: thioredoxin family protein [Pseudobdellovibrionaceae bacterium]|nr:thioredoxin family protein [Pseudobdellovibrionaceae bacterium]